MQDFLDVLLDDASSVTTAARMSIAQERLREVLASAGALRRGIVGGAEEYVRTVGPDAFQFDSSGAAQLNVDGRNFQAGRFQTPTIRELKSQVPVGDAEGRLRFNVLEGASPLTDIGALQGMATSGVLFQVASQFNCLESPGPYVTPVYRYFVDPTQGPRASISAFPATLLRHYAAPSGDGKRFVQETDGGQIELLASACGPGVAPNGYLDGRGVTDSDALATVLEARMEDVRVGLHDDCEVVLGFDWDGAVLSPDATIAQVFTSTVAGGYYGAEVALGEANFQRVARQLLRAAYLGTLLAAVVARKRRAVLPLIGGGVFKNPVPLIWEAIVWSLGEIESLLVHDLEVVLNGRELRSSLDVVGLVLPEVRRRSGMIVSFDDEGVTSVEH